VLMRLACLLLAALFVGGCSSAFDGSIYRGDGYAFRVGPVPPGWRRIEVAPEGSLAFRDDDKGATVAVSGRCGKDGDDVPLKALTKHLFLQFTERETIEETVVPFDGREALHTVMTAKLDGIPLKFDVWVLKKDGCVYDLYYLAPPDRFDRGLDGFTRFVQGFSTEAAHAE